MPGYNHYADCTCGWCVKFGHPRSKDVYSGDYFEKRDSVHILKECGAVRSWTALFVDHNARCPICDARVFYYENRFGSRVYFDELGPPWPKHPCTDNTKAIAPVHKTASVPKRRAAGQSSELVHAAEISGLLFAGPEQPELREFWLAEIIEVSRDGFANNTRATLLDHEARPRLQFKFNSDRTRVQLGDIVALNLDYVWIYDYRKPRKYKIFDVNLEY